MGSFHPVMDLSMSCRRGGGGGRAWSGDLIVVVGPGVWHLTDLVLPREGMFETSPDVEIFDYRLGRRLRPNICFLNIFPASTLHTCAVRSGKIWKSWSQGEQAKAEWISLFCLQISFVWACF